VRLHSHANGDNRGRLGPLEYLDVCNRCLQIQRDEIKQRNRFLAKARRTLNWHATKFGFRPAAFASKYGWDVKQMAHDCEHAAKNGCPYCHMAFAEMANGLRDITLDVYDPHAEPYYTNTRWVCNTCNSKKQDMPIGDWHQVCLAFKVQRDFLLLLDQKAPVVPAAQQLPLFEMAGSAG